MIFIDKMKNLKIYKVPAFLPTMKDNKKKNSAVLMLTPSYESSKRLMTNPLFINRLRYSSYYLRRDVSYYINSKEVDVVEESYISLEEGISSEERNKLKDSDFGIPSKRKYPLDSEERVKSAIRFFNYCDKEDEKLLASNIEKAIVKFNVEINVPSSTKNRFYLYYQGGKYSNIVTESTLIDSICNECGGLVKIKYMGKSDALICENCFKVYKTIERDNINESEEFRLNDKGEEVPDFCPKCGAKVGIFFKGEPVFLCNNKDCNTYFGTVPFKEDCSFLSEKMLSTIPETVINTGDKIIFFNEDAIDSQLYRMIFRSRLRTRKQIIALYDQVKAEIPIIKYTFPDLKKYQQKNLFVDLYYYTKIFFENNTWAAKKGLNLFNVFMNRLINDPTLQEAGYKKKTIVIPITDWAKDPLAWNFRHSLNPMSLIYNLMYTGQVQKLREMFGSNNILFVGKDKYFKMNFSEMDDKDIKKLSIKFKLFLVKIIKNEDFDTEDMDDTINSNNDPDVIKANIIDKIEASKGVDITAAVANTKDIAKIEKEKETSSKTPIGVSKQVSVSSTKVTSKPTVSAKSPTAKSKIVAKANNKANQDEEERVSDTVISKIAKNQPDKSNLAIEKQKKITKLAVAVNKAVDNATSEDDAWEDLDEDEIKQIILDLDGEDDSPDVSAGRAGRISQLDNDLQDKRINGRSVKEILDDSNKKQELDKTNVNASSPNEEWKEISFTNFDKHYDIDKDIIKIFRHFKDVSRPIGIRNIEAVDNSTSEDRVMLYTVEMEDYRGKRFTVKLDIPIVEDNRYLLRGNSKTIQTQLFSMPILKTDDDTCKIISNYMRIFVRRFGTGAGKSLPLVSKFIRASKKYTGRKIKFVSGDNTKICKKYNLPIDYIDLAGVFDFIETEEVIIYFNQDEIHSKYEVNDNQGIPVAYNKKNKEIVYYNPSPEYKLIDMIMDFFTKYSDFMDLVSSVGGSRLSTYSRCSIMSSQIPLVIVCAYHEGLRKTMDKANVKYSFTSTIAKEVKSSSTYDWIKFNDGYLVYQVTYESSLLMNGLKTCNTEEYSLTQIDSRNMYLEFLDNFGGRIKADGLENFYDLMVDPLTKDSLEFYHFPTDYVSILLYANALLADNKYIKHTDTASRRFRRHILIAVYTYKVLSDAYAAYANNLKHNRDGAEFLVKQSAVIDKFLTDTITSDDSCINALREVEATNSITTKGPSGMNNDRAYSLDKRTYDDSMLNIFGMSTGFAGNVGITRQATIDSNANADGYVSSIGGDTSKMNTAKTLTATEGVTPFGTTHDDPIRTAMTFVQTAKHMVRTEVSDPMLVTNGTDEALAYLTSNRFAYKAKKNGTIIELSDSHILIEYEDGKKDYVNLAETIEKNSDGGYYVPLKLDIVEGLKVGQKIKENEIIAYDKYSFSNTVGETDNISYNNGVIAKVAIINTDEGFEDSGVITESMAKKLSTRIILSYDATLDKDTDIVFMTKIGDKVECGDPLMIWQAPFEDEDAQMLARTLTSDEVSELGKKKLKSEVTGVVKGIRIFRTIELEDMSESMRKIVKEYEKPLEELEKKLVENGINRSKVPAHYNLPPTGKLKKCQNAIRVEYYVEYVDTVGVGDKIVYFSANKAVEKRLIPEGLEPYTDFRPNEKIDAFVSEVSIDKRMVCSTMLYGSLQKLMIELDRSVKDIMGIPYDDSKV